MSRPPPIESLAAGPSAGTQFASAPDDAPGPADLSPAPAADRPEAAGNLDKAPSDGDASSGTDSAPDNGQAGSAPDSNTPQTDDGTSAPDISENDGLGDLGNSPAGANAPPAALLAAQIASAALPLATTDNSRTVDEGWSEAGDLQVQGGVEGTDWRVESNVLHILTSTPLTVKNAGDKPDSATAIQIDAGVHADLTFDGVCIRGTSMPAVNIITNKNAVKEGFTAPATDSSQLIESERTSLHLTLADNSENVLEPANNPALYGNCGLRCGEGSDLTIDDSVRNIDAKGKPITISGAVVAETVTLGNGQVLEKGTSALSLDSDHPGKLSLKGYRHNAALGGSYHEDGGRMTFNGGYIVSVCNDGGDGNAEGAGIGGGTGGSGTDSFMIFNGGIIEATGSAHGAGIGSGGHEYGTSPHADAISNLDGNGAQVAGNITINGGFLKSTGGWHGGAFGSACNTSNKDHTVTVTGGTLLPSSGGGFPDLGGAGGYVVISGGSVRVSGANKFQGIGGTAWGSPDYSDEGNKVFMITVDLISDGVANDPIENWQLTIGGVPYPYGAPSQFDEGKLYLWLPSSAKDKVIAADFTYRKTNDDGTTESVTPTTLYRDPNSPADPADPDRTKLKRYVEFEIDPTYENSLHKYYDGLPFDAYTWDGSEPIVAPQDPDHPLHDPSSVDYTYQIFDKKNGTALTGEFFNGGEMPSCAGVMQFGLISREYATVAGFAENFWGHRAYGWCEIKPIPSVVRDLKAEWAEEAEDSPERPGDAGHDADRELLVSAVVDRGATVDGTPGGAPTAGTCKAPEGRVQLYVDGSPVGEPVAPDFGTARAAAMAAADDRPVTATAERVDNGEGGSYTKVSLRFKASEADHLVPDATGDGRHEVSLRFLPPSAEQQEAGTPANYLASSEPTPQRPDEWAEVVIDPIDPDPTAEKDPGSAGEVTVNPDPTPDDPAADPDKPGDKTYRGTITTKLADFEPGQPNPGRVEVKLSTPSSGPITVETAGGTIIEADLLRDADGNPVRDENGDYTLYVDPLTAGATELTVRQKANGAYTGSTFVFDVTVMDDPTIAPRPTLTKTAANTTHPAGPTQAGDIIVYTVTAGNGARGSLWSDAVASDPLPSCMELVEGSVELSRGSGTSQKLTAAAPGATPAPGQYALSAADADGRRTLSVPLGSISGGSSATVTFSCRVRTDIDFATADADDLDLTNVARATGTRPDPDDPARPMPDPDDPTRPAPVEPAPTDPAFPPGPHTAVPADPGADDIHVAKAVENLTRPGEGTTRVGDRLRYTVALENRGATASVLYGALVSDPLPRGIEFVPGTLSFSLDGGPASPVDDAAYDAESRTLAVACGDLWGGHGAEITFECTVGDGAVGADNGNVALAFGTPPSADPGRDPSDGSPDPGKPAAPPADGEEPQGASDPTYPPILVPDDPAAGDIAIAKTAVNTSRDDGTTHVGDTVRYEITFENAHAGTAWMNAVVRDDVPRGLEPVAGTIRLTLPDGSEAAVDDRAYDPGTRILAVACGHLPGGQKMTLRFDALVTREAVGADIGNVAAGYGELPSAWDPSSPALEPGAPFDPPGGWDAFDRSREKVVSDPAYAPGTDRLGGVIDGDLSRDKQHTTIAHKLAQTGDAVSLALLVPAALALTVCAALLTSRRRRNCGR